MTSGKDDPNVVKFFSVYHKLREMIDNDPTNLERLAVEDESIRQVCLDLESVATSLSMSEQLDRKTFTAPVDPKFIDAWRDYENRFASPLAGIFLMEIGADLDGKSTNSKSEFDNRWEYADNTAQELADAIKASIDFAKEQAADRDLWPGGRDLHEFLDQVEKAHYAWDRLVKMTGFDVRGVFRRRDLVPFTLVPRYVSNSHGQAEKLSLFTHLQQAHQAFVFGIPFASIALMRSILELTLIEHYRAAGNDLKERIKNCQNTPKNVEKSDLHRLRRLANDILHFNRDQARLPQDMEKEILRLLHVLRAFIEGAPSR